MLALLQLVDPRSGAARLTVDASANRLLPEASPERAFYDRVRRLFGSDETLLVAFAADDLFRRDTLERLARLTRRLERIDGVHHVVSLANAPHIRGTEEGIEIGPFFGEVPDDPAALAALRREVLENPVYAGNLISRDARATALLVYFHDIPDRDFVERGIDLEIERSAREEAGDAARVWLTGMPRIKAETSRILARSAARTFPLTLAALTLVLLLAYRTPRGVLVPLASVIVAVIATLGCVARIGGSLNLVTVLLPPLLATLGLSYSMHVLSEYEQALAHAPADRPKRELLARALSEVVLPVLLTGLTTAVGFGSLLLSNLGALREFGLYSVLGVLITSLVSLVFVPALLAVLPRPRPSARGEGRAFDRFAVHAAEFAMRRRRWIFAAAALVVLVALFGTTRIRVGTDHLTKFRPDTPVRADFEAINAQLEGANPFYVVLETDYTDAFKEPVNLREVEALQDWLEAQPEVGSTTSLVDYLKLINRGFHENDPAHLAIPETRKLTSQLLFFGASEELERFADSRFQIANLLVRARVIDSDEMAALIARVERRLAALPERFRATVTGNAVLLNRTIDEIVRGQAWSMLFALLLIYGILSGLFVSLRVGLLALIPNLLPVAGYFGALGLFGVNLAPGTSLVAPMVLGVAVDDTIHYLTRFNRDARRLADDRAATVSALKAVGRPVTFTSAALVLGFLTLTLTELETQAEVGAMSAFALGFAWLCDMTLTPALCSGLRVATLWDALALDLGPQPQRSIPVLSGLSHAQARIVALMSSIVVVPAGRRFMHAGEEGRELYVVIDGTLRASVVRDGAELELATHRRGEVVGEVGLFHHRRTANLDALVEARLLCLTPESLERLARRYPRIAARVHRNLNEILANRLARLTSRL